MERVQLILLSLLYTLLMVHARSQPLQNALKKELIQREDKIVRSLDEVQGERGEKRVKSIIKRIGGGGGGASAGDARGGGSRGGSYNSHSGSLQSRGVPGNSRHSKVNEGTTVVTTQAGVGGQSHQGRGEQNRNGANFNYIDLYWWIFTSLATLCILA